MPSHAIFDRSLPYRIIKYRETQQFIDVDSMAEDLQKQYRNDYGRRKRTMFRKMVSQVHQDLLNSGDVALPKAKRKKKNKNKSSRDSSSDVSDDEMELCVDYETPNMMNDSVSSMYNKTSDSSRKLTPSKDPQQFDSLTEKVADSSNLGWFIDHCPDGKKVAKPTRESNKRTRSSPIDADGNNETDLFSNDMKTDLPVTAKVMESSEDKTSSNIDNGVDAPIKRPAERHRSKSKRKFPGKRSKRPKTKESEKDESTKSDAEGDDFVPPGRKTFTLEESNVTFSDVAGNNESLHELARLLLHMSHPEIYSTLGVSPPRGVLLHGPPGCGKTLLGNAVAGQLSLPILRLVGPELIGGVSGESERRVRDVFETAIEHSPCVLFLDEIDAVAQRRENSSKDMERRIVAQLLACLDDLNKDSNQVMVIGATNRPDSLDPALRRAGRFDREICLGIPDEKARKQILEVLCNKLKLAEIVSFDLIARLTPGGNNGLGQLALISLSTREQVILNRVIDKYFRITVKQEKSYVGADLMSLCREAAMQAVTRILELNSNSDTADVTGSRDILDWLRDPQPFADERLEKLSIETKDFELAVLDVQPSAKREGFATVPGVTWADVGALETIREELSIAILGPVRNPTAFAALGLSRASGVLLAGPPGCGKTLLAKAIANESGINFVSVKGPELLNMYVGESERAVRQCFERARNSSPCVIFFDELDSLCPRRSSVEAGASARVVNQMLTELDGLESRKQVFVVAATNRPDIIDPAVLRPGRLDKTLYIGIPSGEDRVKILETITKKGTKPPLSEDVCLPSLGMDDRCDGFTGADLSALVREAALNAIRGSIKHEWNVVLPEENPAQTTVVVTKQNFNDAFSKVCPSISKSDQKMYEEMRKKFQH